MESRAQGLGVRQRWSLVSISRPTAPNLNTKLYTKLLLEKAEE